MILSVSNIFTKQEFNPGIIGLFTNPFYFSRRALHANIIKHCHVITGKVLDVGCGKKPYQHIFNCSEYIGMDMETTGHDHKNSKVDVFYDGKNFPFESNSFDSVICNEVLEHVFNPNEFIDEIYRVLKPDGTLLLTVPMAWDEHEQPFDYGRYTSFGLIHLFKKHKFEIIAFEKCSADLSVIFQLLNTYFYKKIVRKNVFSKIMAMLVIIPINISGALISYFMPGNNDLYLDNLLVSRKRTR